MTSYLVNTLDDTVAPDGLVSLREAIQAANTNAAAGDAAAGEAGSIATDVIQFAPAFGGGSISLSSGELSITDALEILGSDVSIDGGDASRVIRIGVGAQSVTLRDLTLTGGVADVGGGLLLESGGRVTLDEVIVSGNEATGDTAVEGGGGIFNRDATLSILGGSISGNVASGSSGSGGGLFSAAGDVAIRGTTISGNVANRAGGGIELGIGSLLLTDVTLGGPLPSQGNVAGPGGGTDAGGSGSPGNGGGLHVTGDGGASITTVTVTGGEVINNTAASEGGGLWNQQGVTMSVIGRASVTGNRAGGVSNTEGGAGIFNNGGVLTITAVEVTNNATTGLNGGGGGILTDGGVLSIDNTLIAGNFAAGAVGSGGGVLAIGNARVTLIDSEISSNVASRAGGGIEIATDGSPANALTLIGVSLSDNNAGVVDDDATAAAPGNGGGLHITGNANSLIVDSRIADNIAAREGGGLWNGGGTMAIEGSEFLRNRAFGDAADDGGGAVFNNGGVVTIFDSQLVGNVADGSSGSGGGVFSLGGRVSLTNSSLRNNVANRAGGGVESAAGASLRFIDTDLIGNVAGPLGSAAPGNGGGLHVSSDGDTSFVGGIVRGNSAASEGGGLWNGSGTLTIDGTSVVGNVASGDDADNGGGGIFNNGGTLQVSGATISGNVADGISGSGGGVLNFGGVADISDSSITGNVANRAGGGIESTDGSETTLNDVVLDGNNAGVSSDNDAATQSLLSYFFNGSGNSAIATGSAASGGQPTLNFIANGGGPANLFGGPGSGVSGAPGDRAFDNSGAVGNFNSSGARNANDFEPIDTLDAFTLSGWFKVPEGSSESFGNQDSLIENGTISVSDPAGGFRLRAAPGLNSNQLQLRVNRDSIVTSPPVYSEVGQYVYFAVSYDGTSSTDNVKFYKGTTTGGTTLVDTASLNAGAVNNVDTPLFVGRSPQSFFEFPFTGLLDNIRIDGSVVSLTELESRRFDATGLSDSIAANPGNGGGLHISGAGIVRINGGSISGNFAANEGGGLWNSGAGNLFVDGTIISSNTSGDGGGVYTDGGNTVLTDVMVTQNTAMQSGGGLYAAPSDSGFAVLTVNNSTIADNTAGATEAGTGGGGIFAASITRLNDTDVIGNTAVEGSADGGGILIVSGDFSATDVSTTGGEIRDNRAARAGGGVENRGGFFLADGTDFINNFAGVNGGALHMSGGGFLGTISTIVDADVVGNVAANEGGGFWANNSDDFTFSLLAVLDSNFDNNSAMFGGAIFGDGTADVSVDRSTFTGNSADVNGGAIAIEGGNLFSADNTFIGNSAGGDTPGLGGGAIFTGAANEILNTNLIDNTAAAAAGNGGGILVTESGSGTYFGGLIQGNMAGRAGGGLEVAGQITLDQGDDEPLRIDGNSAGINGGGLHISGTGEVTIRRSSVTNNAADGEGGGLWNSSGGTLMVSNATIDSNVASGDQSDQGGGGIYSDGGDVVVTESVINNNVADGDAGSGGGILAKGETTLTSTAIIGNIAVRAGGGIEVVGDVQTTLTDVNLDDNSAGLDRSLAGANVPAPLLVYDFNETGTSALATGTAADVDGTPTLNFNANGTTTPADLHSAPGTGVSGSPDDRAFDNTASSGFSNASHAQHAADFDPIDALTAFTLSGWFMLPSTATSSIGSQDSLIENGTTSAGVRLRGGNTNDAGTLQLTVDGTTRETSEVYTEIGQYVYFAVSYDGTQSADNVKFYKGTVDDGVSLVDTFSIDRGSVDSDSLPLFVGANRQFLFQNPFNGLLDNIRIDGSVLPADALEFLRADAAGQATGIRANPGNGGGLHVSGSGNVDIVGGTVNGNFAASEGGGLWNGSGTMTIDGTTISDNVASGDDADNGGGGVFNNGGTLTIDNADIEDNIANGASGSGGGVFSTAGDVTIRDTTIESNGANRAGGGIEVIDGTVLLVNTDLIENDVNGLATGGTPAPGNGGGLHVSGVTDVTIEGGTVSGNVAASEGGGLWNQAGSTLTIRGGTIIDVNTALGDAADNGGGGIFNNGGTVDVTDAMILSNFADGASGSGGGIMNVNGGVVTVSDSTISRNVASRAGGGIEDASVPGDEVATGNAITLNRVTLERNNAGVVTPGRGGALFAAPGNGGGLHVTGGGNVSISQTTVADNVAANEGGGLWNSVGTLTVNQSTILDNEAPAGGGIFNDSPAGDMAITNSTISGNSADSGGGIQTEGGNVQLTSVTVANNEADQGGGLNVAGGTATVGSSIVASNTSDNISGPITDAGNNVIGGDAGLAPLANNGGPTRTHALLPGSAALRNGDPAGVAVDQRGIARPQGGGADSGAFESALSPDVGAGPEDVDGSGRITALDALMVINFLGRSNFLQDSSGIAEGESESAVAQDRNRLDVNADGRVSPLDALQIINAINRAESRNSLDRGEANQASFAASSDPGQSALEQRRRDIDERLLEELAVNAINSRPVS